MKKIFILFLGLIFLNANECLKFSLNDFNNVKENSLKQCFNATDIDNDISITTKTSGKNFYLKIKKNPLCMNLKDIYISLYDNINKKDITNKIKYNTINNIYNFDINNSYKNISVKFYYQQNNINKIEYSIDNFSIKPNEYIINFKSNIINNKYIPVIITANDYKKNIIENYQDNNIQIILSPKNGLLYDIDFKNGISKNRFLFSFSQKQKITLLNIKFSNIDKDDTIDNCRVIKTEKIIEILENNNSWSGIGTNEKENSVEKNTVNSKILNNKIKNFKFSKMNW